MKALNATRERRRRSGGGADLRTGARLRRFPFGGDLRAVLVAILYAVVLSGLSASGARAQSSPLEPIVELPPIPAAQQRIETIGENQVSPEIPDFHLTQVQLDAVVVKDRVNVEATIEVVINRGDGWHRIPLRLGQAHVWSREYRGPGEEAPDTSSRIADDGISWLIRGIGKHQLRLSMWVPFRRTLSGTNLQLSLPALPPQFETRLNLRLADSAAVLRAARNVTVLDISRGERHSEIEASISGSRLDLTWHTPAATGDVVSQVGSRMHLKPGVEQVSLVVEQSFELQQGGTEHITVRLPSDFRLVEVTGTQFRSYERVGENSVRVHLKDEGRSQFELRWIFERELPREGDTLRLDGLHVEGAVREEGQIRIDEFEGYRLLPRAEESELVHRISVNQLRNVENGAALTAYEFVKQPFHLVLDVTPTLPYFTVDPVYELIFREEELELRLHSLLRFDRGALTELGLQWRGFEENGWSVVSAGSDVEQTGGVSVISTGETGYLNLVWPYPVGRDRRDVRLTSIFRRPLPEDLEEPLSLALPVPQSSRTAAALISVRAADRFELDIRGQSEGMLESVERATIEPRRLPESWSAGTAPTSEPTPLLRLSDPSAPLNVRIAVHQREVEAETTVEVAEVLAEQLSVRQTISLDVRYGRLHEIDLLLPEALLAHMDEAVVTESLDVWLGPTRLDLFYASGILRGVLPAAMKGDFDIQIDYRLPIRADSEAQEVDLPLIFVDETPFRSAQCLITPFETVQVRSRDGRWNAIRTSPRGALWIASVNGEGPSGVPLSVGRRLADSSQQYVVEKAVFRTIFLQDGSVETWAEFQIVSPSPRLVIQFPAETNLKGFTVDQQPLPESEYTRRSDNPDEVTLMLPPHSAAQRVVTVHYRNQLASSFGLARQQSVEFPRFARNVWIDETVWEMHLPGGHHLFTYPDLVPQFEWTRNIAFWKREAKGSYLRGRENWIRSAVPEQFQFEPRDIYAFSGFGPVTSVTFRSMNRSLILLIGAGFTLLLGFVFWKLPATRNVFSLVVIAFLFAAASLWYLEPMLLLLQPAVLGVFLALAATAIDALARKGTQEGSSMRGSPMRYAEENLSPNASTRIYQAVPAGSSERRLGSSERRPDSGAG